MNEASITTASSADGSPAPINSISLAQLTPCPFCGAGDTRIDEQHLSPTMKGPGALISVRIAHWCPTGEWGHRLFHEVRARDHASALAGWNKRVGGSNGR